MKKLFFLTLFLLLSKAGFSQSDWLVATVDSLGSGAYRTVLTRAHYAESESPIKLHEETLELIFSAKKVDLWGLPEDDDTMIRLFVSRDEELYTDTTIKAIDVRVYLKSEPFWVRK